MTWRNRGIAGPLIGLIAIAVVSACTPGPQSAGRSATATTPTSVPAFRAPSEQVLIAGGATATGTPCARTLPTSWDQALTAHRLWGGSTDLTVFAVAPDGSGVLTERHHGDDLDVFIAGPGGRAVGTVARLRTVGPGARIVWAAMSAHHAVWTLAHDSSYTTWDTYVWDLGSTVPRRVSRSAPRAGTALFLRPLVSDDAAYWVRPSAGGTSADIVRYSLTAHTTRVIARGRYSSPILFRGQLLAVRAKSANTGGDPTQYELRAFDATTGASASVPNEISAARELVGAWATQGDLLVWAGTPRGGSTDALIRAWRPGWPRAATVYDGTGDQRFADHEQLAGPLLTFQDGTNAYGYDMRSNSYSPLATYGGQAYANGRWLAVVRNTAQPSKTRPNRAEVDLVDAGTLPPLPQCCPRPGAGQVRITEASGGVGQR